MFHVRCHVSCDRPVAADDPTGLIHLYRITQEAISNAIRHGQAKNIYVDLVHAGDRLILSIEDDGVGFDPSSARLGLGMRTMQHRARLIGATLTVERADGGGTIVTCTMETPPTAPLEPAAAATADSNGDPDGGAHAAA
jgi:two-component system CheB/CheR fusion protein